MGVTKKFLIEGDINTKPAKYDIVKLEYTGWLYDPSQAANDYKGEQFDTSINRGDYETVIGVGRVIQGWETAIVEMGLGEKSELTIESEDAYGENITKEVVDGAIEATRVTSPRTADLFCPTKFSEVKLKDIKRNGSDKWLSELPPQPQQLS